MMVGNRGAVSCRHLRPRTRQIAADPGSTSEDDATSSDSMFEANAKGHIANNGGRKNERPTRRAGGEAREVRSENPQKLQEVHEEAQSSDSGPSGGPGLRSPTTTRNASSKDAIKEARPETRPTSVPPSSGPAGTKSTSGVGSSPKSPQRGRKRASGAFSASSASLTPPSVRAEEKRRRSGVTAAGLRNALPKGLLSQSMSRAIKVGVEMDQGKLGDGATREKSADENAPSTANRAVVENAGRNGRHVSKEGNAAKKLQVPMELNGKGRLGRTLRRADQGEQDGGKRMPAARGTDPLVRCGTMTHTEDWDRDSVGFQVPVETEEPEHTSPEGRCAGGSAPTKQNNIR